MIRDRLEAGAARLGETAREVADSDAVQRAGDGLRGFRAMLTDDELSLSIELFLLALVRAVRVDRAENWSRRKVLRAARRRRRRLAVGSFGAGPLAGVANQLSDLYCETATVCDLADIHNLSLTDEQIAAHMLVLWSLTDTLDEAQAAIDGTSEQSIADILAERLRASAGGRLPENLTKASAVKAIWDTRGLVGDVRRSASTRALGPVLFPGWHAKRVIKRVERHFGLR
jgi:hypothetical protein